MINELIIWIVNLQCRRVSHVLFCLVIGAERFESNAREVSRSRIALRFDKVVRGSNENFNFLQNSLGVQLRFGEISQEALKKIRKGI